MIWWHIQLYDLASVLAEEDLNAVIDLLSDGSLQDPIPVF